MAEGSASDDVHALDAPEQSRSYAAPRSRSGQALGMTHMGLSSRGRSLAEGSACDAVAGVGADRRRKSKIPRCPSLSLGTGARDDTTPHCHPEAVLWPRDLLVSRKSTSGCGMTSARSSCRCSMRPGFVGRHRKLAVHLSRDLRRCSGAGAQRRSVRLRSLRRSRSTCWGTSRKTTSSCSSAPTSRRPSARPSAIRCRATAANVRCASPATASARRNRFIETPDGESELDFLCAGHKAFFKRIDHPMRLMAELLERGHSRRSHGAAWQEDAALCRRSAQRTVPVRKRRKSKHCHGKDG